MAASNDGRRSKQPSRHCSNRSHGTTRTLCISPLPFSHSLSLSLFLIRPGTRYCSCYSLLTARIPSVSSGNEPLVLDDRAAAGRIPVSGLAGYLIRILNGKARASATSNDSAERCHQRFIADASYRSAITMKRSLPVRARSFARIVDRFAPPALCTQCVSLTVPMASGCI